MSTLSLELVADSRQLVQTLQGAQRQVETFMDAAKSAGEELGGGVNRALEAFEGLAKGGAASAGIMAGAMAGLAVAAGAMALGAATNAEQLEQLSAKLGIGTDALQSYQVLLNRVHLSGDDLTRVFKTLSVNLEQARTVGGTAADRFRQLGIDIRTVTSSEDLLRKLADSTSQFANGSEKAAAMAHLMGKTALNFIPAFEGGAAAIDAAAKASESLGATMSTTQVGILVALDHSVSDLTLSWGRFKDQLGAFVAPAVMLVTQALTYLVAKAADLLQVLDTFFNRLEGVASKGDVKDTRAAPPPLVDTARISAHAQTLADAQLKAAEGVAKGEMALNAARTANYLATLTQIKTLSIGTELEIARQHEAAERDMAAQTVAGVVKQMEVYQKFIQTKSALFTSDQKGVEERKKFEIESNAKLIELVNQLQVANVKASTTAVQSATLVAAAVRGQEVQALQDEIDKYKALDAVQQEFYHAESLSIGAADAMRRVRFALLDAEAAKERMVVTQTIADETRRANELMNIDERVDASRRKTMREFPTFFGRQMQDLAKSNAFSMAQIVGSWTNGLATILVKGGDFKAIWQQTQIAVVQSGLNTAVQFVAQQALAATATQGIWAAATTAIQGMFISVGVAVRAFFVETLWPMLVSFGETIVEVLIAVADAIGLTGWGIPIAIGIIAAVAVLAAVLSGGLKFADGGIVTGPTRAIIGEGGSSEAVIPLNSRGAAFMQQALGVGGGGNQTIVLQLDGREIARRTMQHMPGLFYIKTGMA